MDHDVVDFGRHCSTVPMGRSHAQESRKRCAGGSCPQNVLVLIFMLVLMLVLILVFALVLCPACPARCPRQARPQHRRGAQRRRMLERAPRRAAPLQLRAAQRRHRPRRRGRRRADETHGAASGPPGALRPRRPSCRSSTQIHGEWRPRQVRRSHGSATPWGQGIRWAAAIRRAATIRQAAAILWDAATPQATAIPCGPALCPPIL